MISIDNQYNDEKMSKYMNIASEKLGVSPDKLKNMAQSGNLDEILNKLKPEDSKKLQQILSNKDVAKSIFSSPQAQNLLKSLFKDK